MEPEPLKCFLCFEVEKDETLLIRCHNHEVHIACLKAWSKKSWQSIYSYRKCHLCGCRLKRTETDKIFIPNFNLNEELLSIIKADRFCEIADYINTHRPIPSDVFSAMVKNSIDFKSIKTLKHLISVHYRAVDSVALNLYLFKNQSYYGNLWLLTDPDVPRETVKSHNIIDLMIERQRNGKLEYILERYFPDLEKQYQVKILNALLLRDSQFSGSEELDLSRFWDLCSLYPEYSCYIYDELIVAASANIDYRGARKGSFIRNCNSCKTKHLWTLLKQSLHERNYSFFWTLLSNI